MIGSGPLPSRGFTGEEFIFIIKHDIKYRIGPDAEGDGDEGEDYLIALQTMSGDQNEGDYNSRWERQISLLPKTTR